MFEQFPYTNFHELNLDWIIDQLRRTMESAVLSVNGQTGDVVLYQSENVVFPDVASPQWRMVRTADGHIAGVMFQNGLMYVKTKTAWEEIDGTGGGSGGGSKGRLLGTYSTDEDVNAMEIDISGFGEYDYLVFRLNIELATANWIYLWANGSNTNKYLTNVKTHNEDIPYVKYPSGWAAVMTDSTGTGVYMSVNKADSLSFVPYSTSSVIRAGSFIELYGYQALPERDED